MSTHTGLEKQINSTRFLYSNIKKDRRTPFLQRNLTQALNRHHRESQAQDSNEASTDKPGLRSWEAPNDDLALIIASRHSTYELRLHSSLVIRPPTHSHPGSAVTHASLLFTAKCLFTFSLYRKEEGGPWKHRYRNWSEATLKAYRDGTAIASLLQPPTFPSQVFQGLEKEYNGGNLGTHVGPNYVLKISLQCAYPSDTLDVFGFLGIDQQQSSDGKYLRSYVHHLPRCPTTHKGFEIKLADSSDKFMCKSEHTLHVNMDWVVPKMNIMEELNRTIRLERGNASVPTQQAEPSRITYICDQAGMQKPLVVRGNLCPICWMRDFRTVERLQLHMKLEHDRFHFAFKEFRPPESPARKELYVRLTFKERAEKPNSTGRRFQEIRWIAPSQPFNLNAFLGGDESWVGGKRPKVPIAFTAALGPKIRREPENVQDPPKPARRRYRVPRIVQEAEKEIILFAMHSRRPLLEGEHISEDDDSIIPAYAVSKIRRRSSNMPRTAVKFMDKWDAHMLQERLNSDLVGEAVVRFLRHNETWLQKTPGMLNEWFNKLGELHEDGLLSATFYKFLASTAISGFAKARETQMEPSIAKAKDAEAGEKRKRADTIDTVDSFCHPSSPKKTKLNDAPVKQPNGKENTSPKDASLFGLGNGPASNPLAKNSIVQTQLGQRDDMPRGTANSVIVKGETRPKAPQADVYSCVCGKPVATTDAPAAITCANIDCLREDFHLSCVGLDKRLSGWRCDDCAAPNAR